MNQVIRIKLGLFVKITDHVIMKAQKCVEKMCSQHIQLNQGTMFTSPVTAAQQFNPPFTLLAPFLHFYLP